MFTHVHLNSYKPTAMFKFKTALITFPALAMLLMLAAFQWPEHNPTKAPGSDARTIIYQQYTVTWTPKEASNLHEISVTIKTAQPEKPKFKSEFTPKHAIAAEPCSMTSFK